MYPSLLEAPDPIGANLWEALAGEAPQFVQYRATQTNLGSSQELVNDVMEILLSVSPSTPQLAMDKPSQPRSSDLNSAWWDLSVRVVPRQEDLIYWRLETFGCQGMTSERLNNGSLLSIHAYLPLARATILDLAALALQMRQDALLASFPPPDLSWERMESEDWSMSWKRHWQPQAVGDKLLICPVWLEPPVESQRQVLRMDPGMAFGTGVHPTTQLCMEALEMRLEPWEGVPFPEVIADIGCGSGILSIAAALLGVKQIYAVDTEPLAIEATLYNRDTNQLMDQIWVAQGSLEQLPEAVDGIVCNILADVILDMVPNFKLVVKPGGWLILSGILVDQAKFVAETLEANDWVVAALWKRKEWCCLNVRMA